LNSFVASREKGNEPYDRLKLEARLLAGREGSVNIDPEDVFRELLADLWKTIVQPVFGALNLEASKPVSVYYPTLSLYRNRSIHRDYGGALLDLLLSFPSMQQAYMVKT
jgi:hypothetical protein